MISRPAFSPADELQLCAQRLVTYWALAVPPAVASVLITVVVFTTIVTLVGSVLAGALLGGGHGALAGAGAGLGLGVGAVLGFGGLLLGFVALNVTQAVTMVASLAAFEDRPPDIGASFRAVLPRLGDLIVSMIVTFFIMLVPFVLCFIFVGIPLVLVAVYFLIYVQAAVVLGGEGAVAAVSTSIRIARTRVGETVVLAIGVIAAVVLGTIANGIAVHVPILNVIAGFAIGGFTSAFAAMATARFYLALRDVPPPDIAPPSAEKAIPYGGPPTIVR